MAPQILAIARCADDEIPISTHAASGADNSSSPWERRFYLPAPDDRDDEDAPEPGGCGRCEANIRPGWLEEMTGTRDNRFWPCGRNRMRPPFFFDARNAARSV